MTLILCMMGSFVTLWNFVLRNMTLIVSESHGMIMSMNNVFTLFGDAFNGV